MALAVDARTVRVGVLAGAWVAACAAGVPFGVVLTAGAFVPSVLGVTSVVGTAAAVGAAFCPTNHPGQSQYNTLRGGVQIGYAAIKLPLVRVTYRSLADAPLTPLSGSAFPVCV